MLKYRIPAALIIVALLVACLWYDGTRANSIAFTVFVAVGTLIVSREFYRMVRGKGICPMTTFGIVMTVVLVFAHDRWCWEKWHGAPRSVPDLLSTVIALCVVGTCALQGVRKSPVGAISNIGATLLGMIYVWFLPAYLVKLRHLGLAEAQGWQWDGVELVFATILVSKSCDIGGFFVGRRFGRHKLSPIVSPKKTWEGVAGGVVASLLVAFLLRAAWPGGVLAALSPGGLALFSLAMALSGLLGDLLESALKRDSEVKDSGGSVPGFGGLLDVVDSLMLSAPTSYFFFILAGARPALSL